MDHAISCLSSVFRRFHFRKWRFTIFWHYRDYASQHYSDYIIFPFKSMENARHFNWYPASYLLATGHLLVTYLLATCQILDWITPNNNQMKFERNAIKEKLHHRKHTRTRLAVTLKRPLVIRCFFPGHVVNIERELRHLFFTWHKKESCTDIIYMSSWLISELHDTQKWCRTCVDGFCCWPSKEKRESICFFTVCLSCMND